MKSCSNGPQMEALSVLKVLFVISSRTNQVPSSPLRKIDTSFILAQDTLGYVAYYFIQEPHADIA
jgi:hypothetical protein